MLGLIVALAAAASPMVVQQDSGALWIAGFAERDRKLGVLPPAGGESSFAFDLSSDCRLALATPLPSESSHGNAIVLIDLRVPSVERLLVRSVEGLVLAPRFSRGGTYVALVETFGFPETYVSVFDSASGAPLARWRGHGFVWLDDDSLVIFEPQERYANPRCFSFKHVIVGAEPKEVFRGCGGVNIRAAASGYPALGALSFLAVGKSPGVIWSEGYESLVSKPTVLGFPVACTAGWSVLSREGHVLSVKASEAGFVRTTAVVCPEIELLRTAAATVGVPQESIVKAQTCRLVNDGKDSADKPGSKVEQAPQ